MERIQPEPRGAPTCSPVAPVNPPFDAILPQGHWPQQGNTSCTLLRQTVTAGEKEARDAQAPGPLLRTGQAWADGTVGVRACSWLDAAMTAGARTSPDSRQKSCHFPGKDRRTSANMSPTCGTHSAGLAPRRRLARRRGDAGSALAAATAMPASTANIAIRAWVRSG